MRNNLAVIRGGSAMAMAAALIIFVLSPAIKAAAPLTWEAVQSEVPTGKSVRVEVRLSGMNAVPDGIAPS